MLTSGGIGFTGSLLDRADPLRHDEAALEALRRGPAARFAAFSDLRPLATDAMEPRWLTAAEVPAESPTIFLGLRDGTAYFAVSVPPDSRAVELRAAAATMSASNLAILGQARSLLAWHARHQHCSVCGEHTRLSKGGYQRICESCHSEHFPRTDPVVIMLVTDGDRCLLGRQPKFAPGYFSTLAGFVEPGESIEEAVAREVFEEAGVRVRDVRYAASQPWPFPSSLMLGCFAEAITAEICIDRTELEDARWFTRTDARAALAGHGPFRCSPPFAISHTLLKTWAELGG